MKQVFKVPNNTDPVKNMIKHETFKSFIEFSKENLDGKNPICYTKNMEFLDKDLSYLNETINDFFITNLKNLITSDELLNVFIDFARIGLKNRNNLLKNIEIHNCLKQAEEETIKKFCQFYDVNLQWKFFNDSYKDIIKIYSIVKPSEKGNFIYETIINKLKKVIPYSQRISNKNILKIIKENKKFIKFENYHQHYQLGLIEIKDIPIKYFKCEFIHKVMETNKFPIISSYVKGKKDDKNFYENFFKQDFPKDELFLLSKILIINIETLNLLPENKELFLNFFKNIVNHSNYTNNEISWDNRIIINNKFSLNIINNKGVNFRNFFGFNKQKFTFEECQKLFNNFLNKTQIFHFEPNYFGIDYFRIEKQNDIENLFLILEKDFENNSKYNFDTALFVLIKEMMKLKENLISIKCNFNINNDVEKKINKILFEKDIFSFLFLKNNQKIRHFKIELKKINYDDNVLQIKRFSIGCYPRIGNVLPHNIFKNSILEKIIKFNLIDKNNDEIKEFLCQPILIENYQIINILVGIILKTNISEDKKEVILRIINDLPCKDKFNKNIKDKIKLLDIDQKSEKFLDNLKIGCKRKYHEITENAHQILQKPNLEDDVKNVIKNLMQITKEKVVLDKIIENPMIKCPINVEYHEASNFYTLNCGHNVLKNTVYSLQGKCPMCRTNIVNLSETVIQNDFKDLIEKLSNF